MDRLADLVNCIQTCASLNGMSCNHGGGFLDRYDWGYTCGNCGATFVFKYYDRAGRPITMAQWAEGFEKKRMIAFDKTPNGDVFTVWLGLNRQFGDGPPLIFETMVFGGSLDQEMDRYSTEEEAKSGHAKMLARVLQTPDRGAEPNTPEAK